MIVISDTSPLNYLILIGAEEVLPRVFDRVIAPPAVLLEMQHAKRRKNRQPGNSPPAWLEVRTAQTITNFDDLGPGESEAIALALEIHADAVLIDEQSAVAIASSSVFCRWVRSAYSI